MKKVRLCSACGKGELHRVARPGRYSLYRDISIQLPADLPLTECDKCEERYITLADAEKIDAALALIYAAHMGNYHD